MILLTLNYTLKFTKRCATILKRPMELFQSFANTTLHKTPSGALVREPVMRPPVVRLSHHVYSMPTSLAPNSYACPTRLSHSLFRIPSLPLSTMPPPPFQFIQTLIFQQSTPLSPTISVCGNDCSTALVEKSTSTNAT